MTKMNDDNTWEAVITVVEARALLDFDIPENVVVALDQAQAHVFTGNGDAYLVIKIKG